MPREKSSCNGGCSPCSTAPESERRGFGQDVAVCDEQGPPDSLDAGRCSRRHRLLGLALGATGVVFGDIGTSPLYTFTGIFSELPGKPHPHDVAGALSVIFWSLTWVVCFKYLLCVMSVAHIGEGGTFALMQVALAGGAQPPGPALKWSLVLLGIVGCSLIIGDGAITPVISVLGALEGLPEGLPHGGRAVLASAILVLIFLLQRKGARFIGLISGPLMVVWFLSIGMLGVYNLVRRPDAALEVLPALSPTRLYHFFCSGEYRGYDAWRALAGVVLCVTGAEALYADMGYFGRGPISLAWVGLVYPCLVLQYMGQAAVLTADPSASPFWDGVPGALKVPMMILAPCAAVVASQALISGVFSLLTQAHALDFLPRVLVCHTNPDEPHQVYIPEVNWLLCLMCLALCFAFQSTGRLAGAYGITVTCSFVVTSSLLAIVLVRVWKWHWSVALALIAPMILVDTAFLSSNALKIMDSGWVPVVISLAVCLLLYIHYWGRRREDEIFEVERGLQMVRATAEEEGSESAASATAQLDAVCTVEALQCLLRSMQLQRSETVGVFLTPKPWRVPRSVGALAKTLGGLPGTIVLLYFRFEWNAPFVAEADREAFDVLDEALGVYRLVVSFGYCETPSAERVAVRAALARAAPHCPALAQPIPVSPAVGPVAPVAEASGQEWVDEEFASAASPAARDVEAETAHPSTLTFVFSRLYYVTAPKQGHWTRFCVQLYAWLVRNGRQPISFFGLEAENTLEVSTVRFM